MTSRKADSENKKIIGATPMESNHYNTHTMKARRYFLLVLFAILTLTGCHKESHFITDKEYRAQVHGDFDARRQLAKGRAEELFGGMDTLDNERREAMEFLYAYMPYSDLADYDATFFLNQVDAAFKARKEFAWGATVPEDIFRHFVLVYRVNNENLDSARLLMQRELAPRLKGLSMYDAALEVNHWCHEYVAYRGADARTSAPLATMRTGLGRCGEESTFTVTALRSVGIPARQCYTPRWAHCDDNHAWVEVWIEGRWYFLGACEPDAELDMGWFAVPSTRCMMVHSKAFGRYHGDEEVVKQTSLYSELNLLSHYAPTRKVTVTVYDKDNQPAKGVQVKFKLYNYSEFYPLATIQSDAEGRASLTTGLGDLLIWATDGECYNYVKMDVRQSESAELYLTREGDCDDAAEYEELLDMVPPSAGEAKVTPSKEKSEKNARRIAYEDSLRNAYRATFPTVENWRNYLTDCGDALTDEQACDLLVRSEGNHRTLATFIERHTNGTGKRGELYDYLNSYSDKDLRDIPLTVLEAHLTHWDSRSGMPYEVYKKGLQPARVSNELVRAWRTPLAVETGQQGLDSEEKLAEWTRTHIAVDDTGNYYNCPLSPMGVYQLRHSDAHSRDIFFVAACRSQQIPAYLDNATNLIYVWNREGWHTVSFDEGEATQPTATLTLTYKATQQLAKPVYWSHFTLAQYQDGDFATYDFENDSRLERFPATLQLEPGYYCLTTGNRYPEGDVVARQHYFTIGKGEKLTLPIELRPLAEREKGTHAQIDPQTEVVADMATLADYAGETGMLFVFLGDYKEPSKHLVKEMQALREEYKAWGGMIYLVAPAAAKPTAWKLPNTDCVLMEAGSKDPFERRITEALKLELKNDYPLVALVNKQGEILFHSHGYSIGLAEQILKHAGR